MSVNTKKLWVESKVYDCEPGETVLDALLRQKVYIPYVCKQQICNNCMMRSLNCAPPAVAQKTLKETLKSRNYFLACACLPEQDMKLALPESLTVQSTATIIGIEYLNETIISLVLECESYVNYAAGQSIMLMNTERIGKSYHIASPSSQKQDGILEIHVPLVEHGYFSQWLKEDIRQGDKVYISCPVGQVFYASNNLEQPIVLIGFDEGLSPLIGILQDALENEHQAPIHLFHGVDKKERFYLVDDLYELTTYQPNFHYYPCIADKSIADSRFYQGLADQVVLDAFRRFDGWRVYLCGKSDRIKSLQKEIYLAGASTKDIYSIFLA